MKYEPVKDYAERKRISALIEQCEKEQTMNGLVKKEDAIRICKMCASAKYRVPYIEQAFENIPTIDAVSEWIPCSERLPKRQGFYICTCKDGSKYKRVTFVKWSNGWQLTGSRSYWVVVAWMLLPEPWKGADDE